MYNRRKPSFYYPHHSQAQFKCQFCSEFFKGIIADGYVADVLNRESIFIIELILFL